MGLYDKLATPADFHTDFNALYKVAKDMGVDMTDPANRTFLIYVAEQVAEHYAQIRKLYNHLHLPPK
jgi:hypothetical protein